MLEAQVILTAKGSVIQPGDILVLALAGHPWGKGDRTEFLIVQWEDAAVELDLIAQQKDGESYPLITYPYAIETAAKSKYGPAKMTRLSDRAIDTASVPVAMLDATVDKPVLPESEYALKAEVISGGVGVVGTVVNALKSAWDWLVS